eukprot:TRINITY_DN3073_c0_g1_i1.p1 TRINITY_DN3073_c0_g1~~TRINITY_DN3073_c0_g1_i1.p1  ORF type:complete len:283 (-),score=60.14 TRINITY_DN3073_c0_g1_i1:8-856(-)
MKMINSKSPIYPQLEQAYKYSIMKINQLDSERIKMVRKNLRLEKSMRRRLPKLYRIFITIFDKMNENYRNLFTISEDEQSEVDSLDDFYDFDVSDVEFESSDESSTDSIDDASNFITEFGLGNMAYAINVNIGENDVIYEDTVRNKAIICIIKKLIVNLVAAHKKIGEYIKLINKYDMKKIGKENEPVFRLINEHSLIHVDKCRKLSCLPLDFEDLIDYYPEPKKRKQKEEQLAMSPPKKRRKVRRPSKRIILQSKMDDIVKKGRRRSRARESLLPSLSGIK